MSRACLPTSGSSKSSNSGLGCRNALYPPGPSGLGSDNDPFIKQPFGCRYLMRIVCSCPVPGGVEQAPTRLAECHHRYDPTAALARAAPPAQGIVHSSAPEQPNVLGPQ